MWFAATGEVQVKHCTRVWKQRGHLTTIPCIPLRSEEDKDQSIQGWSFRTWCDYDGVHPVMYNLPSWYWAWGNSLPQACRTFATWEIGGDIPITWPITLCSHKIRMGFSSPFTSAEGKPHPPTTEAARYWMRRNTRSDVWFRIAS